MKKNHSALAHPAAPLGRLLNWTLPLFLVLVLILTACSVVGQSSAPTSSAAQPAAGQPAAVQPEEPVKISLQAEIDTAVQATMQSLEKAAAVQATVQANLQATTAAVPAPSDTPEVLAYIQKPAAAATAVPPTSAPTPVPTASQAMASSGVQVTANVATNCRMGPSTEYKVMSVLNQNQTAAVYGRNSSWGWWYIASPTKEGEFCWVWAGSTTVTGDTSSLEVVAAPPITYSNTSGNNYNYGYGYVYGWGSCYPWLYNGAVYYNNNYYCGKYGCVYWHPVKNPCNPCQPKVKCPPKCKDPKVCGCKNVYWDPDDPYSYPYPYPYPFGNPKVNKPGVYTTNGSINYR